MFKKEVDWKKKYIECDDEYCKIMSRLQDVLLEHGLTKNMKAPLDNVSGMIEGIEALSELINYQYQKIDYLNHLHEGQLQMMENAKHSILQLDHQNKQLLKILADAGHLRPPEPITLILEPERIQEIVDELENKS